MHVYIYIYIYLYIHAYTHAYLNLNACTHISIGIHIYMVYLCTYDDTQDTWQIFYPSTTKTNHNQMTNSNNGMFVWVQSHIHVHLYVCRHSPSSLCVFASSSFENFNVCVCFWLLFTALWSTQEAYRQIYIYIYVYNRCIRLYVNYVHAIQSYSASSICMQSPKPEVNKSSGSICKSPKPELTYRLGTTQK